MRKDRYELLKDILNYGYYSADIENGDIYNKHGRKLKGGYNRDGYKQLIIRYKNRSYNYRFHEIIAVAMGLNLIDKEVNHIDGNKENNRFSNLEAVTWKENMKNRWDRYYRKVFS